MARPAAGRPGERRPHRWRAGHVGAAGAPGREPPAAAGRRPAALVAAGDAALAVDPVSGSGVPRALRTAEAAARLAEDLLDRPGDVATLLAEYEAARDEECTAYLTERAAYYAAERRYRTPFWARRASAAKPPVNG
ncbi:MAG TPA: hypothetical protein VLJ59_13255 [Mycobacteriales bacterium]|nr:hypothetical protein [Mycobacteriales bacterium]